MRPCSNPHPTPSIPRPAPSGARGCGRTTRAEGVWLISYKKTTGEPRVEYDEAVEEALCFGWIDSKANKLDDERSMLWMSPRKPRTGWSRSNKERVERLIAGGLMTDAGLALVEAAKRDGSWNALDAVEAMEIPPDLVSALAANGAARQYFDAFPPSVKRGILSWIQSAKRPETRAKRIEETPGWRRRTFAPINGSREGEVE